jgi:hypothetical protein
MEDWLHATRLHSITLGHTDRYLFWGNDVLSASNLISNSPNKLISGLFDKNVSSLGSAASNFQLIVGRQANGNWQAENSQQLHSQSKGRGLLRLRRASSCVLV